MKDFDLLGNIVPVSELRHDAKSVLNDLQDKKQIIIIRHHDAIAVMLSPDEYLRLKTRAEEAEKSR